MVAGFCSNGEIIRELQASFGKLCRVGTFGDVKWTKEETQTKMCNYVHAKPLIIYLYTTEPNESTGLCSSLSMVVDTFVSESLYLV
jgi:hypothetical protein